jgi:spermidine/putrescine transport system ATP-binding protein
MTAATVLELRDVTKTYAGAAEPTLRGVSLELQQGEFFALIGSSGCGKTTTLKLVAGIEDPTSGSIRLDDADLVAMPMHRRPVHTVFQNYALFPHLTVAQNIAFGLREAKTRKGDIDRLVGEAMDVVDLQGVGGKKPGQLSGGMQQRVALARSLVLRPRILLLDEPLGALDLKLRHQMQVHLKRIQRDTGVTFLYVTHDQEEAFSMSDRVGYMQGGSLVQVGAPEDVYARPHDASVARFIGSPNVLPVARVGGAHVTPLGAIPHAAVREAAGTEHARELVAVVRPEHVALLRGEDPAADGLPRGTVRDRSFRGQFTAVTVTVDGRDVTAYSADRSALDGIGEGDAVALDWLREPVWVCPA